MAKKYFALSVEQGGLYEGEKIVEKDRCLVAYGSVRSSERVKEFARQKLASGKELPRAESDDLRAQAA